VQARGGRGKRWEVTLDGEVMARFSRIEEAVEAVDYEVASLGRAAAVSALAGASWRSAPPDAAVPRDVRYPAPRTVAEALRLAVFLRLAQGPNRLDIPRGSA
jgi:hypothetical protein